MRTIVKIISLLILLFSTIAIPLIVININQKTNPVVCNYAEICIDSDDDFASYGFQGKGTEEEPYLIENIHSQNDSSKLLYIANTTVFFIIRNCSFESSYVSYMSTFLVRIHNVRSGTVKIIDNLFNGTYGLEIIHANSVVIQGNRFESFEYALKLAYSNNSTITNNIFRSKLFYWFDWGPNGIGITISECENIIISKNQFYKVNYGIRVFQTIEIVVTENILREGRNGIYIDDSCEVYIQGNIVNVNWIGIWIKSSPKSIVEQNNCTGGDYGIYPNRSPNTIIRENHLINTGIYLYSEFHLEYATYRFEYNYINEKPLGFFIYKNNLTFREQKYGQLIFVFCDDIEVKNQNICNTSFGVFFIYCSNITIENSTFNYNLNGIKLRYSSKIKIRNNILDSNFAAIRISSSFLMTIKNNTLNAGSYGIIASDAFSMNITRNYLCKNDLGVFLEYNCEANEITYNVFLNHTNFAVDIHGDMNEIHHNSFYYNYEMENSQGYDSGQGNYWYDTATNEGNWWSNWSGNGTYPIYGRAKSVDPFPLSFPPV